MKNDDFYIKYPHIIKGSIEEIQRGTIITCSKNHKVISHGKICVIRCADVEISNDCLKTRIINIQDAKQVTRCIKCARMSRNTRRHIPK